MKIKFTTLLLLAFAIVSSCKEKEEKPIPPKQPNIIYIISDGHTAQGIGAYGSRFASLNPTPTIDRIAKGGVLMENVFCTNSICTPSRASILTGQYGQVNGVVDLSGRLSKENQYLPIEMGKLGYDCHDWQMAFKACARSF